jgi:hypothetical protein
MKFVVFGLIAGGFVYMPIYLVNTQIEPQLHGLYETYSNAENIANQAAGINKQP